MRPKSFQIIEEFLIMETIKTKKAYVLVLDQGDQFGIFVVFVLFFVSLT